MSKKLFAVIATLLLSVCYTVLRAQVGIGTGSPKALLDISASNPSNPSNTDGLLVPRIDAFPVVNPTVEQDIQLVFLTTTDGSKQPGFYYWDNSNTTWTGIISTRHYIGELYGGGIVYYTYDNGQHGLIINVNDSPTTLQWQATPTITGARSISDGVSNTGLMTDSAVATYVNGLTDGGFTDWYLPSSYEIKLIWETRFIINKVSNTEGYTLLSTVDHYWSSREDAPFSFSFAFVCNFLTGGLDKSNKSNSLNVRAIRAF